MHILANLQSSKTKTLYSKKSSKVSKIPPVVEDRSNQALVIPEIEK